MSKKKEQIFTIKKEDEKCAPNKKFEDNSCFTIEQLKDIANAYNKHKKKEVILINNRTKKQLVIDITKQLDKICEDQLCWLDQEFIRNIVNIESLKKTFRPIGPQGKFKWLNTTNINEIMKQYQDKYTDFHFLGAVPIDFDNERVSSIKNLDYDELTRRGIYKLGVVFNLDEHWQNGSHWCALFADLNKDKNQVYFFDSYGTKPEKRILDLIRRISKWCYKRNILNIGYEENNNSSDSESLKLLLAGKENKYEKNLKINYNRNRHQYGGSECGVYSINFILRLLKGESFEDISNKKTTDSEVNECRKEYFRFK